MVSLWLTLRPIWAATSTNYGTGCHREATFLPPSCVSTLTKEVEAPDRWRSCQKTTATVADRIAQTVVKLIVEPIVEPVFHENSYGYRPNRCAHQTLAMARKRCWRRDWVIDLDIKGFFDNLDHELMMKAVRHHTQKPWGLLYRQRWLEAPVDDGKEKVTRTRGTPQGGVISPLLANLFMHYAFDHWLERNIQQVWFER